MSALSFTEEEWIVDSEPLSGGYRIMTARGAPGHALAIQRDPHPVSPDSGISWAEALANAHLISALPNMYKAMGALVEEYGLRAADTDELLLLSEQPERIADAMRALAKAKGEAA